MPSPATPAPTPSPDDSGSDLQPPAAPQLAAANDLAVLTHPLGADVADEPAAASTGADVGLETPHALAPVVDAPALPQTSFTAPADATPAFTAPADAAPTLVPFVATPADDAPVVNAPVADAPWPVDRPADLRPDQPSSGGPSLPGRPMLLRLGLIAAAGVAAAIAVVQFNGSRSAEPAAAPAAPPAQQVAGTTDNPAPVEAMSAMPKPWTDGLPTSLSATDLDPVSLDLREVRPKRVAHQLELVTEQMAKDEDLAQLTIRTDGSMEALLTQGPKRRIVVTKGEAPAADQLPASLATTLAMDAGKINTRVPAKLIRVSERDGIAPPTSIVLARNPEAGSGYVWELRWTAPGSPRGTAFASADGITLAKSPNGL